MSDANVGNPHNRSNVQHARSEDSTRSRFRRQIIIASVWITAIAVLALAAVFWLQAKASIIRTELDAAVQLVPQLKDDVVRYDAAAATDAVDLLKEHTGKARAAAGDPLWTIASSVPWIGANFQAVSEISTAADDVARLAADPLADTLQSLDWKALIPSSDGVDLQPLTAAKPKLAAAAHAVGQSSDRLNRIDTRDLLPQISDPLLLARDQLSSLRDGIASAADAANVLPGMMGEQSPRRYLLLIQNNAESRATGGIPGALAVLNVDKGKLSLDSQTSATAMGAFNPTVRVDPEQSRIYSARLGKFMQDVNLTPDFPTAALTATAMWKTENGEKIDGVLSIDPVALGYILDATGPVRMSDPLLREVARDVLPTELTAKNVVPTLLSDVYSKIGEPDVQDVYFAGVAREVFTKLSAGSGDARKLVDGLTRGASERRILLWSSKADEESIVSRYPLGGSVTGAAISPAQFGVYFNDGTGAKMDYHVKRTVQLVEECPADGYGQVKVRITSTNTAPKDAATSLPTYVTGGGAFGVPAGSVQTNIVAYGPVQSNVETAFVSGKKTGFASYRHSGRPVGSVTVRLAPGESSTVDFMFGKIVQHTVPQLSVTPTVQALKDVVLDTIRAKCAPAS
ncbi:DUF4012 domain-containing protein [Arthrobacter globiformis]|uniref:DUF4012 domain-containing protein n=1 Tax=Arthrobacter globiformis TaxID=1665 RepID=UPI002793DF24|nr:DUF4012 domain-containing protein [Arthrobacter globiformis]MDQ0620123.1 hypothetical protein [Arthrobacter globiformis]